MSGFSKLVELSAKSVIEISFGAAGWKETPVVWVAEDDSKFLISFCLSGAGL